MMPLEITFEVASEPQTFVHVRSQDGLLGHAEELRARIPVGTWVTIPPSLHRLVSYLLAKCGFAYHGVVKRQDEFDVLLRREA